MASNAQAGTMTGWGHWGGPKHPGIAMVLATVLSIASFVLEIYHAKEKLKIDATPTDLVAAASFTFVVWTFVIMFLGNDWRMTFKLHAFLSFCLTLVFGILSAIENDKVRKDATISDSLYTLSLAACILAWCALICLGHVLYCCFWSTFEKRFEKKDVSFFVTIASFFISCLAFALWLNSSTTALNPIMTNWVHGLFIAGSMFALVASISYLFNIISDGAILELYAGIASVALLIFAIGGLALLGDDKENAKFLSVIIFTFVNVALLLYLARNVFRKIWAQSWSGRILVLTVVIAVIQYSLAMTKNQPNTTVLQATPVITKANWWLGVLSAGFACTIAAAFFSTIKKHLPTSLNFNFAALLLYVAYFIAETYYFDKSALATASYDFIYRKTIVAIVLAAAIIILLLIAVIIKFLAITKDSERVRKNCRVICRSCCYTIIEDETGEPQLELGERFSTSS